MILKTPLPLLRAPATFGPMRSRSSELGRSPFWERSSRALPDPEDFSHASNAIRPPRAAAVNKTHQRASLSHGGQIGRKGARAVAALAQAEGRLPATITRVERFGETRCLPGITDAGETVEANPSHQVNHAIA